MMLPPSPALSFCDSLDGIEDLDAFLDNQGGLSHFPTPPLANKTAPIVVQAVEAEDDMSDDDDHDDDDDGDLDYDHIALILTEEASLDVAPTPGDIEEVLGILISADVPLVVVALAFNILSALHSQEAYAGRYTNFPPDLLVVSALSLAVTCTYDAPHGAKFWSQHVCRGRWTTAQIEQSIMKVLVSLDFRLHEHSLPDRLDQGLAALSPPTLVTESRLTEDVQPVTPAKQPMALVIESTNTVWSNGQITPDETPCDPAFPAGAMPVNRFLRLL